MGENELASLKEEGWGSVCEGDVVSCAKLVRGTPTFTSWKVVVLRAKATELCGLHCQTHSHNKRHVHPSIFTYLPAWSYPGKVQEREAKMRMSTSVGNGFKTGVRCPQSQHPHCLRTSPHHHSC